METELTKYGQQGWHPGTLPPANTSFGPKILLQRELLVAAYPDEKPTSQLLTEVSPADAERLAQLQKKFGM